MSNKKKFNKNDLGIKPRTKAGLKLECINIGPLYFSWPLTIGKEYKVIHSWKGKILELLDLKGDFGFIAMSVPSSYFRKPEIKKEIVNV